MAKITLSQLSTFDNTNVSSLNDSLQKIEDALNENVLYRDNITGEPNQAEQEYDMNSFRIINLGAPVDNSDAARLIDVAGGGSAAVSSVFGRDGDVVAEDGDYTTDQVTEGSNLYYTSSRVQSDAPVSSVANKTGAVSINPSDIEQEGATDGQVMTWDNTAGQWEPQASGGAPVDSVFGRTGAVVAEVGDYDVTHLGQTGASDGQTLRWSDFNSQWEPAAPGAAPVDSVFGRTGFVTAQSGDYTTDQVSEAGNLYFTNARASSAAPVQDVAGKTGNVTISPEDLEQQGATQGQAIVWDDFLLEWAPADVGGDVSSVFGRTGTVTAQSGDYNTDQVTEGANLYFTNARANNAVDVPIDSVFGRTGTITAQAGDYSASKISIADTGGNFSSSFVEGALTELAQSDFSNYFATPEEFGATGDGSANDTTPLQNAIDSGRIVLLGANTYRITSELNVNSNNLVMIGSGPYLTSILADNCDGIDINQSQRYASIVMRDFSLLTNADSFIGIDYNNSDPATGDKTPKVIENVHFFGQDRHNFNPSFFNTWGTCIDITDGDTFNISYCYFQGAEEDRVINSTPVPNTYGVKIHDSTRVALLNCMCLIFGNGFYISGQSEGARAEFTNFVACGYGVLGDNLTNPANAFIIKNCHISSYIGNVVIGTGTSPETQLHNIIGCVMFKRGDGDYHPFHQVDVFARHVSVTDNSFRLGGAQDPSNDRSIVLKSGSDTVLISNNIFFNQDRIILLGGNNIRVGIFNNVVNDDGNSYGTPIGEASGGNSYVEAHNFGDRTVW